MPQVGEKPTKPWEGRGGTYTMEEEKQYKEQLKAYEKEKDVVEKQQADIRKRREEVLNWYKQAVQELTDIQAKAHDEEVARLEKEKDKWTETVETIKVKMAEVKKEIDAVRESLSVMKLTIENSQAKEAIDQVKEWLQSLYTMADNVITLTVKSTKGGTTPGVTPPATPSAPITGSGNTFTNIPTGTSTALPAGVRKEGETYTNKPEIEEESIKKVGDTWMNVGKAAEGKPETPSALPTTPIVPETKDEKLKQATVPTQLPADTPVAKAKAPYKPGSKGETYTLAQENAYKKQIKEQEQRLKDEEEERRKKALGLRWGGLVGRVLHAQTGAVIPGFGGGDSVPALLEAGERVFSKETNQFWGNDFLDNLDKMARSPKLRGYPAPIKTINSSQQISNDNRNLSSVSTQNSYTMNIDGRTGAMPPSARDMLREATRIIEGERRRR